jgi:hypothetical protein
LSDEKGGNKAIAIPSLGHGERQNSEEKKPPELKEG